MPPQVDGIVDGVSHMSTKDLPDGSPEDELKTAKDHKLGHLQSAKKIINSWGMIAVGGVHDEDEVWNDTFAWNNMALFVWSISRRAV